MASYFDKDSTLKAALPKLVAAMSTNNMISSGFKKFAKGGIADRPSIFGEAGPEAAVPLPDGKSIPVKLNNGSIVNDVVAAISGVFNNSPTQENTAEENTDREMLQELTDLRKDIKVLLAAINNSTQEGNKAVIRAISDKFKDNRVLRS